MSNIDLRNRLKKIAEEWTKQKPQNAKPKLQTAHNDLRIKR